MTELRKTVWLTTNEAAEIIGVTGSALRRWRTSRPRQGPPFVDFSSNTKRYALHDVEEWLMQRRVDPGSVA